MYSFGLRMQDFGVSVGCEGLAALLAGRVCLCSRMCMRNDPDKEAWLSMEAWA